MAKRNSRNTRGRIISAAWKLFYEQGYDGTTVEDIVFESGKKQGPGPERSAFGQMFTLYPLNPAVPHRIMEKNERSPGEPSRSHI